MRKIYLLPIVMLFAAGCEDGNNSGPRAGFFVTSVKSVTGNLGGLTGADATCQRLAAAVSMGDRTWRAYLSVERDPTKNNQPTHARDRIGSGPWYNVNRELIANN